jgi:GT2 family glycosyltransferase
LAKGDVLTFVDSDDIWLPNKLKRQVEAFEDDQEVGLVSCGFRAFGSDGETIFESVQGKSGWVAKEILLFKEPVLNTSASAIAVRREIFDKVGGFDERREIFSAEDRDFCYHAAKISKLTFIPEILVDYRIHGSNGHLNIAGMEKAFLASYEKIFAQADNETLRIKRETYGNLYAILAGAYFRTGRYGMFVKNTLRTLWLSPSNLERFAGYPARMLKRTFNKSYARTNKPYP